MPTNLPPEYAKAEERFKAAETPQEKIDRLEELIATVPKHKGTDKLRADLRRRLSKLKASSESKQAVSRHVSAFYVGKEGAGQVAVIGCANVGKSALVATLTNATPEVADYPFTTWTPTTGMMDVDGVQIQLIDTPPLNDDYMEPALIDLIRRSDLLLLVLDIQADPFSQLEDALALLAEHRIEPKSLDQSANLDHLVSYRPMLVFINKVDDQSLLEDFYLFQELVDIDFPLTPISTNTGRNLDLLKKKVFKSLKLMRIYTKPPGEEADLTTPYALVEGSTVEEFALKVHRDFYEQFKSARLWGSGVYDGQLVGRDHVLNDGDIVELHI